MPVSPPLLSSPTFRLAALDSCLSSPTHPPIHLPSLRSRSRSCGPRPPSPRAPCMGCSSCSGGLASRCSRSSRPSGSTSWAWSRPRRRRKGTASKNKQRSWDRAERGGGKTAGPQNQRKSTRNAHAANDEHAPHAKVKVGGRGVRQPSACKPLADALPDRQTSSQNDDGGCHVSFATIQLRTSRVRGRVIPASAPSSLLLLFELFLSFLKKIGRLDFQKCGRHNGGHALQLDY